MNTQVPIPAAKANLRTGKLTFASVLLGAILLFSGWANAQCNLTIPVTGTTLICDNSQVGVIVDNTQAGYTYQLRVNGNNSGNSVTSAGGSISLYSADITANGTYTISVRVSQPNNGCSGTLSTTLSVSRTSSGDEPNNHSVIGGGLVCPGTSGVTIGLDDSNDNLDYKLYRGVTTVLSHDPNSNSQFNFPGTQTTPGKYFVMANRGTCQRLMDGHATVTTGTAPNANLAVTATTGCSGTATISVANTQTGVSYQLRTGNTNVGSAQAGNGGTLSFNLAAPAAVTTYNVLATNGTCPVQLTQTATVRRSSRGIDFTTRPAEQNWINRAESNVDGSGVNVSTSNYSSPGGTSANPQGNFTSFSVDNPLSILPNDALAWITDYNTRPTLSNPNTATSSVTFNFSQEVTNLTMQIADLDKGTEANAGSDYTDELTLQGYTANNTPVTLTSANFTLGTNNVNEYIGNNLFRGKNVNSSSTAGSITITFPQAINRLVLVYKNVQTQNSNPGVQAIGINNMRWCTRNDLAVTNVASPGPYYPDRPVTFTVTATNNGATAVSSVGVTNLLPAGFTFVSAAAPGTSTYNSSTGIWNVGSLNPGQVATLTVIAQPIVAGMVSTTATIFSGVTDDPISSNNSATASVRYSDFDGDGVSDLQDIDANNDGITNLFSDLFASAFGDADADGILNYRDTSFSHPTYGTFRDLNADGINDWFDLDKDGLINAYDLDMDGDGILNTIEANGGLIPLNVTTFSSETGNYTGPVYLNGMPIAVQSVPESGVTILPMPNSDSDSDLLEKFKDFQDLDSDNDGLTDNLEAQELGAGFIFPSGIDSNRNGIDNNYDLQSGGTILVPLNFDMVLLFPDNIADYRDLDSDGDGFSDASEGFDNNGNGRSNDDLLARAAQFVIAGGNPAYYNNALTSNGGQPNPDNLPNWLLNNDSDEIRNYLDEDSPYYFDTDNDGLIDLFDADNFGVPASPPDNGELAGFPDFRDSGTLNPLPVELISFTAKRDGDSGLLEWSTAKEENNAGYEIQASNENRVFNTIGFVNAIQTAYQGAEYSFVEPKAAQFGTRYYRIIQHDLDGTQTNLGVRSVNFRSTGTSVITGPNPFTYGFAALVEAEVAQPATLILTDVLGREVARQQTQLVRGVNQIDFDAANLGAGSYILSVQLATEVLTVKVNKQ